MKETSNLRRVVCAAVRYELQHAYVLPLSSTTNQPLSRVKTAITTTDIRLLTSV
jgi:hypothetical protein